MDNAGQVKYIITADSNEFLRQLNVAERALQDFAVEAAKQGTKAGEETSEGFGSGLSNISQYLTNIKNELGDLGSSVARILGGTVSTAATAATASLTNLLQGGIQDTSALENIRIKMISLTHSVEDGNRAFADTAKFYKNNPFNRFETTQATSYMLQYGQSIEDVLPNLEMMGKVSLSTGNSIDSLAYIYSRILAQGKVGYGDLQYFVEKGLNIYGELQKVTGKSQAEIIELASNGKLGLEDFKKAFANLGDPTAYEMFNQTLSRAIDKYKGRISDLKGAISGYTITEEEGLIVNEMGLYRKWSAFLFEFARIMASSHEVGQQWRAGLEKIGNTVGSLVEKITAKLEPALRFAGQAIQFLGDHTEILISVVGTALVVFGNLASRIPVIGELVGGLKSGFSGLVNAISPLPIWLKLILGIVSAGAFRALFEGKFNESLKSIGESLLKIFDALSPIVPKLLDVASIIGEKIAIPVLEAFAKVLSIVADTISLIPTDVLAALAASILLVIPACKKLGKVASPVSKAASAFSSFTAKSSGQGIITFFSLLGNNVAAISKGALALIEIGGAIGIFIGAIGGGIWLFGEGIEAIGRGLDAAATGTEKFAHADLEGLSENIGYFVDSMSGLIWRSLDLATAASTFYGIGVGLIQIAEGCEKLNDVHMKSIQEKLPALASSLQEFAVDAKQLSKTENILTKFRNLGDSIKSVGDLVNVIANIKIENEKMKKTMTALADGLKQFLIPEFQPSWWQSAFGNGHIDFVSVLDRFESLEKVIQPLDDFIKVIEGITFDPKTLKKYMTSLADGLQAFLIKEFTPSWISKVFAQGWYNWKSVTDYLESLSTIIQPLNDIFDLMSKENFNSEKFTTLVKNLGESLRAFIILEPQASWWTKTFGTVLNTKSITDYFDSFEQIIKPLNDLFTLLSTEKFDADTFNAFLKNVADSLKSFIVYDVEKSFWSLVGGTSDRKTAKGILDFFSNFELVVKGLKDINDIMMTEKFDSESFVKFVSDVGEALKSFVVYDIDKTVNTLLGSTTTHTKVVTVLEHLGNLELLVTGIKDLSVLFNEDSKFDSDNFITLFEKVGAVLKNFSEFDEKYVSRNIFGGITEASETYTNVFEHLGDFNGFVDGILKLAKIASGEIKFDEKKFNDVFTTIGRSISSFTFIDGERIEKMWKDLSYYEVDNKSEYTNVLEHIGDFGQFATGISNLLSTVAKENISDTVIEKAGKSISVIVTSLASTGKILSSSFKKDWFSEESHTQTYDSVFAHTEKLAEFIDSISGLITSISNEKFNITNFSTVIKDLGAIISLLPMWNTQDQTVRGGFDNIQTASTTNLDTVFAHMQYFKDFCDGIKILVDAISSESFDSVKFSTAVENIVEILDAAGLYNTEESSSMSKDWGLIAGSTDKKSSFTTIYEHLGDFKGFAEGIKILADTISQQKFDIDTFKTSVQTIFEAVKTLALEESSTTKETQGIWGIGGETSTTNVSYSSILDKIGDFKSFADALKTMISDIGIGRVGSDFKSSDFSTAMTSIAGGFNTLISKVNEAGDIDIDVDELSNLISCIKDLKTILLDWDTTNVPTQATNISSFISGIISEVTTDSDTFITAAESFNTLLTGIQTLASTYSESLYNSGVTLMTSFANGLLSVTDSEETLKSLKTSLTTLAATTNAEDLLETYKSKAATLASTFIEKIKEADWYGGGYHGGYWTIYGLIAGLQDEQGLKDLKSQATSTAKTISTTISNNLKIASPSKVMFKIGAYVVQGLAEGISSQRELVENAMIEITDSIRQPYDDLDDISFNLSGKNGNIETGIANRSNTINMTNNVYSQLDMNQVGRDMIWQAMRI